jgi:glutathione synthase/RimK-type ligase-like ATP-grasp enzyme
MKTVLGIMLHRLHHLHRFLHYRELARKEGFDDLILFTPASVDLLQHRIDAYRYENQTWQPYTVPFPTICHDMGYYVDKQTIRKVKAIKNHPKLPFVGYSLGSKLTIQQHLAKSPRLSPYLLPTIPLQDAKASQNLIQRHQTVMIKPVNGKGGQGIIRLSTKNKGYWIEKNGEQPFALFPTELADWLKKLQTKDSYLLQPWIDIRNKEGNVFDIRVLVQKNRLGEWQLTGMGVREATDGKITSNLKSGGNAYPVRSYLTAQYGKDLAQMMNDKLIELSEFIPSYLEQSYNKRFVEFGLDLAADRKGQIWIIEVNIKPGKTLYGRIADQKAAEECWQAPIQYASYLVEHMQKGRLRK